MTRVSLVGLPAEVQRAYSLFELVQSQWRPGQPVKIERNKTAYYDTRRYLTTTIHEAMAGDSPPFPREVIDTIAADVNLAFDDMLFYIEPVSDCKPLEFRVHIFYGGYKALTLDNEDGEGEVYTDPLGSGHGHLIRFVNSAGMLIPARRDVRLANSTPRD